MSRLLLEGLSFEEFLSPFGRVYIFFVKDVLYGLSLSMEDENLRKRFFKNLPHPVIKRKRLPENIYNEIKGYFDGTVKNFSIITVLDTEGCSFFFTEFERRVLNKVREVPYGETRTYTDIARSLGYPDSRRAVGQVLRRNPIPLVIPCHRIIGRGGDIHGYSLGIEMKRRLLMHEYYHLNFSGRSSENNKFFS